MKRICSLQMKRKARFLALDFNQGKGSIREPAKREEEVRRREIEVDERKRRVRVFSLRLILRIPPVKKGGSGLEGLEAKEFALTRKVNIRGFYSVLSKLSWPSPALGSHIIPRTSSGVVVSLG